MNERDLAKFLKKCKYTKIFCKVLAGVTAGVALMLAEKLGETRIFEEAAKMAIEEQNT